MARERRSELKVDARVDGAVGVLHLQGEVRAELVGRLHEAAAGLLANGAKDLVVDLSGVSFIDSASVGEMLRLDRDLSVTGGVAVLHSLPRIAKRVLEVTGLADRFRIASDESAARALLAVP
jgi:anti-sigma B factor antagonist